MKYYLYKTVRCSNVPPCRRGQRCGFAHDDRELRPVSVRGLKNSGFISTDSFRTFPCFTWVSCGWCPYQDYCVFLHDKDFQGKAPLGSVTTLRSASALRRAVSTTSDDFFPWPVMPNVPLDEKFYLSDHREYTLPEVPTNRIRLEMRGLWNTVKEVLRTSETVDQQQQKEAPAGEWLTRSDAAVDLQHQKEEAPGRRRTYSDAVRPRP